MITRSTRAAARWIIAACALAVLASVAWWYSLVLDESLTISTGGLTYRLLVPDELTQERLAEFGKVLQYNYSAADGPKPTITVAMIEAPDPTAASLERITKAYVSLGFSVAEPGHLVHENAELDISSDAGCANKCRVTLALSQHP
jgi:hypothetical protein